ncbi:autoinducer synthase [Octadecabacter sp. CECT 8868]|uniref:acyl-homoserine-lactone synthase n=1 Tax=Octadecabacter algicola TaxID=2909342 RepID=UPI001F2F076F|nr:acyl-homoserine-lactone synthase [Octadecabacter algicola]MCF2906585.1 autoinducer synthase [Octadecabacter algicola]
MLRYLYGSQLKLHPVLADSMFRHRAAQFHDRLGWDVTVDRNGHERDSYDDHDPLYVIWQIPNGRHGGSMRFLPTTGPTMVNDHFSDLMGGGKICSKYIWESTRFCLAPDANARVAAALMLGGGELMRGFGVRQFVGVFDARMVRIYRRTGSSPTVLGSSGQGRDKISVGLWDYHPTDRLNVLARAGLSSTVSEHWYARAFGQKPENSRPVAA